MKKWWEEDDLIGDITPEKLSFWGYVESAFAGVASGGWVRKPCPRCEEIEGKPDYKLSLGFNTDTGGFNCFKCAMKGSLPMDRREALALAEPDERSRPTDVREPVELAESFIYLFEGAGADARVLDPYRDYLLRPKAGGGRNLPLETAAGMRIGCALSGKLRGRVIVPIPDYGSPRADAPWRGWVARDAQPKSSFPYRYPTGMVREGLLWNESALWVRTDEPAFIGEGVFDASVFWPDGVACMGKPLESHLAKFRDARRPLVVCLDGDAWEEGRSLGWTLKHMGLRAGSIRLPPRTDPDEVELSWLREQARLALE